MPVKAKSETIDVPPMTIKRATVTLRGLSPLLVHAWSVKARQEILDKQMKKAKQAKEPKNPEDLFREAMYHCPDGQQGFPAVAFKAAAVDACSHVADITKVTARGAFHIIGDMIPLQYESVTMQQDMVRIGMGTADVRIRPRYDGWSVTFDLRYNANVISLEQLALLFDTAGFSIGVGEWRPQKDGSYGMFECASVAPLAD